MGMATGDTIELARKLLDDLGGIGVAGERLELFLAALAGGNPDNVEAACKLATSFLVAELTDGAT